MKSKAIIILAVITVFGLVAASAWAGPWGGPRGVRGGGPGYCATTGPQSQAFLDETADLRNELATKRGEYHALMAAENPDPKRAGQLQQEMNSIREQIRTKAQDYQELGTADRHSHRGYDSRGDGWGHHRGGRGYCR